MLADERTRLAQLDAELRRLWALLSLFPAPFDLSAAAALWGKLPEKEGLGPAQREDAPSDDLGRALEKLRRLLASRRTVQALAEEDTRARLQVLRNRSLLTYDPDSTRYHQHDLVRLAAAGDLEALTEQESYAAHLRLACHYEQVAREANRLYRQGGGNVLQGLALFDLEWPHIRAGQAWAAAHANDDEAARLCSAYAYTTAHLLSLRLHPRDRIARLKPALQAARRLGDRQAEGWHLNHLGLAYVSKGEWDRAIDLYEQSLAIKEQVGDIRGIAKTTKNLGLVYGRKGEWDRAIEFHEQALETMEQVGDIHSMATTYGNLGSVYLRKREWDQAIALYQQALETMERVGDIHGMAQTRSNLGVVYQRKGEWDRAIEFYEQALETMEQVGDIHGMATT